MPISDRSLVARIDWGHIALLLLLVAVTVWYLHDAWAASSRVRNLILVLPASVLALCLAFGIAAGVLYRGIAGPPPDTASEDGRPPLSTRIYPVILMGIFALYVLTLPVLGFDVGSAVFLLIALIAEGERRPLFLVLYAVAFAAVCTVLFRWLLPYPMHTLIL